MSGEQISPQGWEKINVELASSEIISGSGFPKEHQGDSTGDYPFAKVGDISRVFRAKQKYIGSAGHFISEEVRSEIKARVFPKGAIVFPKIGEALRGNYRVVTSREMLFDNNVMGIIPDTEIISGDFLYYFLTTQDFGKYAVATAVPSVRRGDIASIPLSLPPLPEQHRIVAKIEELFSELDKGIENLKTARAQLKVYRQALLKHAFEGKLTAQWRAEQQAKGKLSSVDEALKQIKPIPRPNRWKTRSKDTIIGHSVLAVGNPGTSLPEGWLWVPMVDIARMESGHTPSRNHSEWWGGDIPWISIPDARKNHGRVITDTVQKTNPLGIENSAARVLPASTVCVSRTASVGYVVELGKPMATSQDFVNWTPSEAVRPEWLRLIFGADREALLKFGKGTTHQTIYFPEWLSVHIGLPSIEEQKKIIEEVESRLSVLDQLELTITNALQQAEALRQSILKKAFSGQLVPQDPHDEPASELLARIRAERADTALKPKRKTT